MFIAQDKIDKYIATGITESIDHELLNTPIRVLLNQPGSETEDGRDLSMFRRADFVWNKLRDYRPANHKKENVRFHQRWDHRTGEVFSVADKQAQGDETGSTEGVTL